uniref:Secreted protein n=1 Tax=Macrostomum lignano TaxID=282301 RepID=A0A1I8GQU6_9PLAT
RHSCCFTCNFYHLSCQVGANPLISNPATVRDTAWSNPSASPWQLKLTTKPAAHRTSLRQSARSSRWSTSCWLRRAASSPRVAAASEESPARTPASLPELQSGRRLQVRSCPHNEISRICSDNCKNSAA